MDLITISKKGFITILALIVDREEAGIQAAQELTQVLCGLPWPGEEQYSHDFEGKLQALIDKYPYLAALFQEHASR